MKTIRTVAVVSLGLCLAAGTAGAQSTSKVQMVKDGKTTALPHVAAARYVAPDGKVEIRLLFATAPPEGPVADAAGNNPAEDWARKCQGCSSLLVTFQEAAPEQYSYSILHGGSMLSGGGTLMSGDQKGVAVGLALKDGRIGGTMKFEPGGAGPISGRFDAPLASVTAVKPVTGPAVAASAPAKALLEFARAMTKKDFAAAQKLSARDVQHEMAEAKKAMGDEFVNEMLKEMDPKKIEPQLKSPSTELVETGDAAEIRLIKKEGGSTSTQTFRLVKVGGQWKMK
jgi:hypothetical protein